MDLCWSGNSLGHSHPSLAVSGHDLSVDKYAQSVGWCCPDLVKHLYRAPEAEGVVVVAAAERLWQDSLELKGSHLLSEAYQSCKCLLNGCNVSYVKEWVSCTGSL